MENQKPSFGEELYSFHLNQDIIVDNVHRVTWKLEILQ